MAEYVYLPIPLLDDFCMTAFKKLGFKKSECRIITDRYRITRHAASCTLPQGYRKGPYRR